MVSIWHLQEDRFHRRCPHSVGPAVFSLWIYCRPAATSSACSLRVVGKRKELCSRVPVEDPLLPGEQAASPLLRTLSSLGAGRLAPLLWQPFCCPGVLHKSKSSCATDLSHLVFIFCFVYLHLSIVWISSQNNSCPFLHSGGRVLDLQCPLKGLATLRSGCTRHSLPL